MQPIRSHRCDILLIIFSSVGVLGLVAEATSLTIKGILPYNPVAIPSLANRLVSALGMLFIAGLLLPELVLSIKRYRGDWKSDPLIIHSIQPGQALVLVAGWLAVVAIGSLIDKQFAYGWAWAAPLSLLGISLPILSLIWIVAGGLPAGSNQHLWGVFDFGMIGSTSVVLLPEYLLVGMALIVFKIFASDNPQFQSLLNTIKTQVMSSRGEEIQTFLTFLAPYLTNPLFILSILIFAAVVVPLIEEAVKPAILWFLGSYLKSPTEGFVLGALAGAGFALVEGILATNGLSQMWGFGIIGRAAASLMHIISSGLLGWGIASFLLQKRYKRLVTTYLLSVTIHGLWNGSAIMAVYGAVRMTIGNGQIDPPGILFLMAGSGMLLIELVVLLFALLMINQRLRRSIKEILPHSQSDIIPPLVTPQPRDLNGMDS
jgi:RsiW-degrading membrane proteinase PrsW (M82 family)